MGENNSILANGFAGKPLTRADIEEILLNVGTSSKLELNNQNLDGIFLEGFDLREANLAGANLNRAILGRTNLSRSDLSNAYLNGADLSEANLEGANLKNASLSNAILTGANLRGASLRDADLSEANMIGADLGEVNNLREVKTSQIKEQPTTIHLEKYNDLKADNTKLINVYLSGAELSGANLRMANLSKARLSRTNLNRANLEDASLREANLVEANLREANLAGADLTGADLKDANLNQTNLTNTRIPRNILSTFPYLLGAKITDELAPIQSLRQVSHSTLNIRVLENPLTSHNIVTILSTITDLHTKCWLISQGRFVDLISYTQTRNSKFIKEAYLVITKITYNSPANFNFDVSPQSVAEALGTGIDAIAQTPYRFKVAKLESHLKELEVKKQEIENQSSIEDRHQARKIEAQKAEIERQKALIEIEKQKIELAKQEIELQKARLELEENRINYALETARKMVDLLQPGADEQTKAMLLQTLLPNLMQLGEGKGLTLSLSSNDRNEQNNFQKS